MKHLLLGLSTKSLEPLNHTFKSLEGPLESSSLTLQHKFIILKSTQTDSFPASS